MTDEDEDHGFEDCSFVMSPSSPNLERIGDLRTLLNSSKKRILDLKNAAVPDRDSLHLEQAIIKGVTIEIAKLEKEILLH